MKTEGSKKSAMKKMRSDGVDFGTYHHSTPRESEEVRDQVGPAFSRLLKDLYAGDAPLKILDAGCGLGFLMGVAAGCFPAAHVTGIDLFAHNSLSAMSMEKAMQNMKSLGIELRTSFLKHDLTRPLETAIRYDLIVSSAVFHNMGKKRFKAYETVFDVLEPGGFFVIGDLFPHDDADDMEHLRKYAALKSEVEQGRFGKWTYRIKVMRAHV